MVVGCHFDKFLRTLSTDRAFGQIHESHLGYHVEEVVFTYEVRNKLNLSLTKCFLINSRRYTMWLVLTRADIAAYVGYLQRNAQAPTIKHALQANRILKWCKRTPSGILFQRREPPLRLTLVAGSA